MSDWDMPPTNVTNDQLFLILQSMRSQMGVLVTQNSELVDRIETLETDQKDMLEAWKAAGVVLKGVKALTVVLAAGAALVALFKGLGSWR